jgi:hypothetical protein
METKKLRFLFGGCGVDRLQCHLHFFNKIRKCIILERLVNAPFDGLQLSPLTKKSPIIFPRDRSQSPPTGQMF